MEKESLTTKQIIYEALKIICFIVLTCFNIISIFLAFSVYGNKYFIGTQISTFLFPLLIQYFLIIEALILVVEVAVTVRNVFQHHKPLRKNVFMLCLSSATAISLICGVVQVTQFISVVTENGGNMHFFDTLESSKHDSYDERIVYAHEDGQDLDLLVYKSNSSDDDTLKPVYVYIHGGGWSTSSASVGDYLHRRFADEGFVGFSVNYRLSTPSSTENPTWDKAIVDVNNAMKWVYEHAKEYGGNPNKIFLCGESAGGHLCLLYTGQVTEGSLDGPKPVAVAPMFPATDLEGVEEYGRLLMVEPPKNTVSSFVGGTLEEYPERWEAINPFNYICEQLPPIFIVQGEKDSVVDVGASRSYIEEVNAAGGHGSIVALPYCNHGVVISNNLGFNGYFSLIMNFTDEMGLR